MTDDPNETLRELREVQRQYEACIQQGGHPGERCTYGDRMSELFASLDQLLSDGKTIPNPWRGEIGRSFDYTYFLGEMAMWRKFNVAIEQLRPEQGNKP